MIDTHIHLQEIPEMGPRFFEQCKTHDITQFFCNGIVPTDWGNVYTLYKKHTEQVIPFFGVHPWYVESVDENWDDELIEFLETSPSGVGEMGLDKGKKAGAYTVQIEVFKRQLEIAQILKRPASIHCVKAWDDIANILSREWHSSGPILLHTFTGSEEIYEKLKELNIYVSFSIRSCEHYKNKRTLLERIPKEKILVETDFPYVPLAFLNRERSSIENYVQHINYVYQQVAGSFQITVEECKDLVKRNGSVFANSIAHR